MLETEGKTASIESAYSTSNETLLSVLYQPNHIGRQVHLRPRKDLEDHKARDDLLTNRSKAIPHHVCEVPQSPILLNDPQKHL